MISNIQFRQHDGACLDSFELHFAPRRVILDLENT